MAMLYSLLQRQAGMLSFADVFWLLGVIAFSAPFLTLFNRKVRRPGTTSAD